MTQNGSCQVCHSQDLCLVLDLGLQPISNRFRADANADEARFPLSLVQCNACGLVQLRQPPPAAELTPPYSWLVYNEPESHLDQLAETIAKLHGPANGAVVWGLSFKDDSLLRRLEARGFGAYRLDPAGDLGIDSPCAGVETIQQRLRPDRVGPLIARHGRPNIILARHILEHVHDLGQFLATMKSLLAPGGYFVIEVPDCEPAFRLFDYTIVWEEHASYFTGVTLSQVFSRIGMRSIFQEIVPLGHESLVVAIGKADGSVEQVPAKPDFAGERSLVSAFADAFPLVQRRFADALTAYTRVREKVAVLGAGHLACAFINYLRLEEHIAFIVDDNPRKQGLYLPGTKLCIRGSASLIDKDVRLCLLSVSPEIEQKVIDRNRPYTDRGGRFASIFTASARSLVK